MPAKGSAAVAEAPRKGISDARSFPDDLETDFQSDRGLVLACLNLALDGQKREAIAAGCGMTASTFSKVVNGSSDSSGLRQVLDGLPHEVFVTFMKLYGESRGLKVREQDTGELTEEFLATVDRLVAIGRLLRIKRPKALKARL